MNPTDSPPPTVWPTFRARNARALIDFLVDGFGFVEVVAHEQDGVIHHAELAWPEGGGIMLGDDRPGGSWTQQPGSGASYVVCADPDAVHARALAAGAEIVEGPVDRDYGSREFIARDPEGNLWSFGTYRGAAYS